MRKQTTQLSITSTLVSNFGWEVLKDWVGQALGNCYCYPMKKGKKREREREREREGGGKKERARAREREQFMSFVFCSWELVVLSFMQQTGLSFFLCSVSFLFLFPRPESCEFQSLPQQFLLIPQRLFDKDWVSCIDRATSTTDNTETTRNARAKIKNDTTWSTPTDGNHEDVDAGCFYSIKNSLTSI